MRLLLGEWLTIGATAHRNTNMKRINGGVYCPGGQKIARGLEGGGVYAVFYKKF